MSLVKPLVMGPDGLPRQLQAGDTLDAPQSGGDHVVVTNDEASPIVIGTPTYIDANNGVKKARANAIGTKNVVGLVSQASISAGATGVVQTDGVLAATTGQWDAITGGVGGLVANTRYFLDPTTAGMLTSTVPTTVGQYVAEVGIAISTTEMEISIASPILL